MQHNRLLSICNTQLFKNSEATEVHFESWKYKKLALENLIIKLRAWFQTNLMFMLCKKWYMLLC